ncbi:MAG: hypothetical protein P8P81_04340 [Bacteroidia bacterium]|jgi:hypothetical protein|nr:hypothetical protein [Bacteroidia bacterium]
MQLKNKISLFTALLLGGFFLQSCSDEDENTPSTNTTDPSGCYVTQEVVDDGEETKTITYVYNDNNNIISASSVVGTGTPSTTTFEYDGNRIVTATDIQNIYEFKYSGNNSIPSRIDVKEGSEITGYYVIQSSGLNVSEFEEHDLTSGDDIIESTTTFEYDSRGNMSKAIASELDEDTKELAPFLTFEGSVYDGKINPYNSSFVFFFMDPGNPSKVGKENLVSGQLSINGFPDKLPLAASYEYNDDQYPTSLSLTVPGLITESTTISYDCK